MSLRIYDPEPRREPVELLLGFFLHFHHLRGLRGQVLSRAA